MSARPTIFANANFNAQNCAEFLHKSMAGRGCDKPKIVQALCSASNAQRQEAARVYKAKYGKDLRAELKSELGGDFEELALALMEPRAEFDARQLRNALKGLGTKESVLIEILTTRNNAELRAAKDAYRALFDGADFEADLVGDTSGDFQRLMVALACAERDETSRVDRLKANQDARALRAAGEQQRGTDESVFNAIFASQNAHQLRALFDEYGKLGGLATIEKAIEAEFSGDVRDALLAVAKCARNRSALFAELIHNSMKGLGTRDSDLIRLIVSRAEVDLADVRDAFQREYKTTLEAAIAAECSGAYRDALVALVKGN